MGQRGRPAGSTNKPKDMLPALDLTPYEPTDTDRLIYDTYQSIYLNDKDYHNLWHQTTEHLLRSLNPRSVLELGCGAGIMIEQLRAKGIEAQGVDRNPLFLSDRPDLMTLCPLESYTINRSYDAIVSVEVFEHMTDEQLSNILPQIAPHCKHFVFSSTPHATPDDEYWGHINIKSKQEWIRIFKEHGLNIEHNWSVPTHWTMVFRGAIV